MKPSNAQTKNWPTKRALKTGLALILALSVSGCLGATSDQGILSTAIPPWPTGGPAVRREMDEHCPILTDELGNIIKQTCPATDDWHDRLGKLKDKLELLRNPETKVSDDGRIQK